MAPAQCPVCLEWVLAALADRGPAEHLVDVPAVAREDVRVEPPEDSPEADSQEWVPADSSKPQ